MSNNCIMFVDQFNNLQYFTSLKKTFWKTEENKQYLSFYTLIIYPTSSFNVQLKNKTISTHVAVYLNFISISEEGWIFPFKTRKH